MTTSDQQTFDKIKPLEALQILKILVQEDPSIRRRIEEIFLNKVKKMEFFEILDEVFSDLDFLSVEELWEKSGSPSNGYTTPEEAALEMIEEVIEPHLKNMQHLHSLGMFREEMRYCMGVISGLYMFERESTTQFKDWAVDISGELASQILTEWINSCQFPELLNEMKQFETTNLKNV